MYIRFFAILFYFYQSLNKCIYRYMCLCVYVSITITHSKRRKRVFTQQKLHGIMKYTHTHTHQVSFVSIILSHGSQCKKKNMLKRLKGDSQNVKHIKLKLHNFHGVFFIYFNLNFIHHFIPVIQILCYWRKRKCVVRAKTYYRMAILHKFLRSLA